MRSVFAVLIFAAACTPEQAEISLSHRGQFDGQAKGFVMGDTGKKARIGMGDTMACDVNTRSGWISSDYYAEQGTDGQVVDGQASAGGGLVTLMVTDEGYSIHSPDRIIPDRRVVGILDAGFGADEDVVVMREAPDCVVEWRKAGERGRVTQALPESVCDGMLAVDTQTSDAWIADGDQIWMVTPDGRHSESYRADIVVFDPFADLFYAGLRGDSELLGIDTDGTLRWSVSLEGGIQSIANMGTRLGAAVTVQTAGGQGAFVWVDATEGKIVDEVPTPTAAQSVSVSADGEVAAFGVDDTVHFFNIMTGVPE